MKDNSLFRIILCFLLLGSLHFAFAQDNRPDSIGEQHPPFPYRLFRSDNAKSTTEAQPLVVFLHGAGERGNDNNAQLKHCIPFFLDDSITSRYPFLLLVPQCPTEKRWVNTDWSLTEHQMESEPTAELLSVIHLVDSLINCGVADSTRVYLCGISMGGFGVWDALQRWPNKFAAAIPICGGGDPVYADRMKDVPIYIFHGLKDNIVLPSRSIKMHEALQAAGSNEAHLITYPDLAHGCWDEAFSTPGLFQWLFSKNNRGKCFDMLSIRAAIEHQLTAYPESTLQDIYKSFYQDRFGPGHMISDTVSARSYLMRELSEMGEAPAVYYESTGSEGRFVRVYLSAVADGLITAEQLLDAFVRSANMVKAETDWEAEWKAVVATITKYGIQVQGFEDASSLDEASRNHQAVHHSRAYNAAYHPHYRIVERSVFEKELMPLIKE